MDLSPLERLGLTDGEIKVYTTLLDTGRAPITLIAKKTHLNRTGLYDILENLIERGLVSYIIEEKKKYFRPAAPARILEYLDEQQQALEEERTKVNALVGQLSKIKPLKAELLNVEIFRGKKGMKTILEGVFDECKKGDEVLVFGFGTSNFIQVVGHYYHHYIFRTIDAGLKFRAIFDEQEQKEKYVKKLGKLPLTEVKFSFKEYETVTHTRIYGNKVAIMILEKEPTAILIDDKDVAAGYRYFFEYLWERS